MFDLSHDTFYQRRLTFSVFPDESHFITTFNREIRIPEDNVVTIRLAYPFHNDRITAASGRRRKFKAKRRSIFFIHFNQFQLLQHLHTALYLKRLTVCSFETFDEIFRFLNHLLLLFVLLHLLFATFLTQHKIL